VLQLDAQDGTHQEYLPQLLPEPMAEHHPMAIQEGGQELNQQMQVGLKDLFSFFPWLLCHIRRRLGFGRS
jgi:hypothetical protein